MYIGAYIFRPHPIHNIKQEAFSVLSYADLKTRAEALKNNPSSATQSTHSDTQFTTTASSSSANNMKISIVRGQLIQEVRQWYSSWLTSVVRLERDNHAILFDWTVGPIPVDDDDNGAEKLDIDSRTSTTVVEHGREKRDSKKGGDRRMSHSDKPDKDHDKPEEHHHKHSSSHTIHSNDDDDLTTRHIGFKEGNGGKEIVLRVYAADIHRGDVFYTDDNGREFQRRRRNSRETWNLVRLAT